MIARKSVVFVAALAVGAAFAVTSVSEAKKKPESYLCQFGKKALKCNVKQALVASYGSLTHQFVLTGGIKQGSGLGTKAGQLTLSGGVDLDTAMFPVTIPSVSGAYLIGGLKGSMGWAANSSITVTITGYDSNSKRITGTFSGTMEPGTGAPAGIVTITKGKFALDTIVN